MRLIRLAALGLALAPASVSAAVMLHVGPPPAPPCYSASPACDRSMTAPLRDTATPAGLPDPAVAAIVGIALVGAALGRRRSGLPEVVS